MQTISLLNRHLQSLSIAREEWWNSPAKREQRREWSEAGDQKKLTELQVINQKTTEMIAEMEVVLGRFVRWNLNMNDGLDGLEKALVKMKI